MKSTEKIPKYFLIIVLKLLVLSIAILFLNVIILLLINTYCKFHLSFSGTIFIAFLPIFSFLFFFLFFPPETNYIDKLAHFKYNPYFPYFYYYTNLEKNKKIDVIKFCGDLQDCDIVLRRYKRYLDGIIFSQNSYFTHVGIYYKDKDKHKVLHSIGSLGVHESSLEDFCECDDIAIFRFSLGDVKEEEDVRRYIKGQKPKVNERPDLISKELNLFEEILATTKLKGSKLDQADIFTQRYRDIVLSRARILIETPYDFNFDFGNPDALSCIEYVWFCFKCLFPFHRIRVKDFEFFNLIKLPIIIPDVFIKNDFFDYIWSSIHRIENVQMDQNVPDTKREANAEKKGELKKLIRTGHNQFWFFLLSNCVWNIIVLVLYGLIKHLNIEHFPHIKIY